ESEIEAQKRNRDTLAQFNDEKMRELKQLLDESKKASGDGDRKAKLIYKVEPEYTADAREKKIEGSVLLGVTIDHDGVPQNPQLKKSLYPSLDQSAIDAVRKWRFEPAIKNGQPVSMWITVEVYFGPGTKALDQDPKKREAREKAEQQERDSKETTVMTRRSVTEGERQGELKREFKGE